MNAKSILKADGKVLAILDQGFSSGMSFIVMYHVADSYSLTIIAVLNLVNNIAYSFATITKSQLLYAVLVHKKNLNRIANFTSKMLIIPKLKFSLIFSMSFAVFFVTKSKVSNLEFSIQMTMLFIGVLLTDYFRNALIHNGLRVVSFKLNIISTLALIYFVSIKYWLPINIDIITFWSILQFVFPFFVFFNFARGRVKFLERVRKEIVTGRFFFTEALFSRVSIVLSSLYILYSNSEVAGSLAIAYLIFAAFPSMIASALQPISNNLVSKNAIGNTFKSVVITTYLFHIIWFPLFLLVMKLKPYWFPFTFQSAREWCLGIVLASMTTAFLNLYQMRMLVELGSSNFLGTRLLVAIFTGPISAIVIVNSNAIYYTLYTFILFAIVNPLSYRMYMRSSFFHK